MNENKIGVKLFCIIYKRHYKAVIGITITIIMSAILSTVPSVIIGMIYDTAEMHETKMIIRLSFSLILVIILNKLLELLKGYFTTVTAIKINNQLTHNALERLFKAKFEWISNQKRGEILQIINDDIESLRRVSVEVIPGFVYKLIISIAATIVIAKIYYPVLIIALVVYPWYITSIGKNSKRQRQAEVDLRESKETSRQMILESFENIKEIKIYGNEEYQITEFSKIQNKWAKAISSKYIAINIYKSIPRVLGAIAPALAYVVGGFAYINGDITIGNIITLVALLPKLNEPIREFSNFYININNINVIAKKLYEFINAPVENEYEIPLLSNFSVNRIRFENVSLNNERGIILDGATFEFSGNSKIAIIGETGSGKSTILKMIVGLIKPSSGEIYINEININNINCLQLRQQVGFVLQENCIFGDTLINNINYIGNADSNRINYVCEKLSLDTLFLKNNDDIGEVLNNISGGERQRINIGRILMGNYSVILMDEPSSELDIETEDKVMDFIFNNEAKDKMVIYTAHKMETLKYADIVLRVEKGKIINCEKREDFLKNNSNWIYESEEVSNE